MNANSQPSQKLHPRLVFCGSGGGVEEKTGLGGLGGGGDPAAGGTDGGGSNENLSDIPTSF